MIVRDLFASLGLDINAASFAEGEAAISLVKAGLGALVDGVLDVGNALKKNLGVTTDYTTGVAEAAKKTEAEMEVAAQHASTIQEWLSTRVRLLWAKLISFIAPEIQAVVTFFVKNALFIQDLFGRLSRFVEKNWSTVKVILIAGAAAITAAFVILKWNAIAAAASTAAAWIGAAAPFLLIGGLIAGLLLALDDVRVYMAGGDSLFGRWKAKIDDWLSPKPADAGWLVSIKHFLTSIKEALTRQGAIESWMASVKQWFVDIKNRLADIDWTPIKRFFGWLADKVMSIDWESWGERIKNAVVSVKDELAGINFKAWIPAIEGAVAKLQYAYYVVKALVGQVKHAAELFGRVGDAIGDAGSWAFGGKKAPAGGGRAESPQARADAFAIDAARKRVANNLPLTEEEVAALKRQVPGFAGKKDYDKWAKFVSNNLGDSRAYGPEADPGMMDERAFQSRPSSAVAPAAPMSAGPVAIHLHGTPDENRQMVREELQSHGVVGATALDHAAGSLPATE